MCPPSDAQSRSDERGARASMPPDISRDLEAALAVAFSTLPMHYRMNVGDRQAKFFPTDPTVVRDLAVAVVKFVTRLKEEGEPPQNVLVALKAVLREQTTRQSLDVGTFEELQRLVVTSAVKAYFGHRDEATAEAEAGDAQADGAGVDSTSGEHRASGGRRLVLIVDDDEDTRYLFSTYLTTNGYEVVVAPDGLQVVNIARRLKPSLILLDIAMPRLDGRDVALLLQAADDTRRIPIVAVTGAHTLDQSPELMSLGFCDVLIKPVRQVELVKAVQEHCLPLTTLPPTP